MSLFQPLLILLPLGLDTLGVSLGLGIKSVSAPAAGGREKSNAPAYWLRSAILFSLAEMVMPIVGLVIGYAASLVVSNIMHYAGALLLIGVGVWELGEEGSEYLLRKRKRQHGMIPRRSGSVSQEPAAQFQWRRQLLLALSVSLDELAIGFSFGSLSAGKAISPITFCLYIGLQGFLMAVFGISLGRALRTRMKSLKEWCELLSALLLIGLGIWLLVS